MGDAMKRVLACIVAALLMCVVPLVALADETPAESLSITIENGNDAISIEGYQCSAYKVANAAANSYGFTEEFASFAYNDLTGEELIADLVDSQKVVNKPEVAAALSGFVKSNKVPSTRSAMVEYDNGAEKAVIDNLTPGYYLITVASNGDAAHVDACSPILVTLIDEDLTVAAKFEKPTISKVIVEGSEGDNWTTNKTTAEVNQVVSFRINTFVPMMSDIYSDSGYVFTITDTWSDGLDPDMDSLSITVDGEKIDFDTAIVALNDSGVGAEDGADETENDVAANNVDDTESDNNDAGSNEEASLKICKVEKRSDSFEIIFDPVSFYARYSTHPDAPIVVTYNAKVTKEMLGDTVQMATNDVKVTYSNAPGETGGAEGEQSTVYSLIVDVWKYTEKPDEDVLEVGKEGGISLSGAEFVLYKVEYVDTDSGDAESVISYYYLKEDGTVGWTTEASKAETRTTDGEGNLTKPFSGLAAGQYFLKETKAPNGFNKLLEDEEIWIDVPYSEDDSSYSEIWIANNKGIVLPGTGGVGTIVFYCVGGALVIGALVVLIARRRMSSRDK